MILIGYEKRNFQTYLMTRRALLINFRSNSLKSVNNEKKKLNERSCRFQ